MGEPGTKIILTICTKVAETMARQMCNLPYNPYFQSAGDDQLTLGDEKLYKALWSSAEICGLKPSKEKFGCFNVATMYCE